MDVVSCFSAASGRREFRGRVMIPIARREFLRTVGGIGALSMIGRSPIAQQQRRRVSAVAFDGFALFDATAVVPFAEAVAPGRGAELVAAWRARHFEYQWLRTLGGQYADFQTTAADALVFAAKSIGITLTAPQRAGLVEAQAVLRPWPDAAAAIAELRGAGLRLALLSNMTARMLTDGLARAGLANDIEFVLSTDRVRAAKPAPSAYAMGPAAFNAPRTDIAFVAFAGWDAAGAGWFGYPTAWLNRSHAVAEELGVDPQFTASQLAPIVEWITSTR